MSTFCLAPYKLKDQDLFVPCGKCPNCWKRRISAWSFRLRQELKVCDSSNFITLTYNNENLPMDQLGVPYLEKRDCQLFFKRLRKAKGYSSGRPIRYFIVGEYGGRFGRPHFHAIVYNASCELIDKAWMLDGKKIGLVHFGSVTGASIGYTLKYMMKAPKKVYDDRPKQFCLMSKGLGKFYLTEAAVNWHKSDVSNRMYCPDLDGKKVCMPRYYKDRLYSDEEKEVASSLQAIKSRELNFKAFEEDFLVHGGNMYSHRTKSLIVAYNAVFKQSNKRRDL